MNEDHIDSIGCLLEDNGLSHSEIDVWFEHQGVKGMKWGQRKTARIQGQLDRAAKVRDGTATKTERLRAANRNLVFTSKQAGKALERGAKFQKKVADGKSFMGKMMLKYEKTRLADLDYHQDD